MDVVDLTLWPSWVGADPDLLGIDEVQVQNGIDSGRFSMGSSLSPLSEKKQLEQNSGDQLPLKTNDKEKFKSLGDLHMEKGLPTVLVNQ